MNHRNPELKDNYTKCYLKYFDYTKMYINTIIRDPHISEELAQEVFIIFFQKSDDFNPASGRVRNFIFKIARNKSLDYIKKKKLETKKYSQIAIEEAVMDRQFYEDIEDTYIEGEILSTFYDTINSLPENERDIIYERLFSRKQLKQITSEYHVSKFILKKIEYNFAMKIRDSLGQYFVKKHKTEKLRNR